MAAHSKSVVVDDGTQLLKPLRESVLYHIVRCLVKMLSRKPRSVDYDPTNEEIVLKFVGGVSVTFWESEDTFTIRHRGGEEVDVPMDTDARFYDKASDILEEAFDDPIVIVVDGIIGAGKSSIIEKCLVPILTQRGYKVCPVYEPVETWKENGSLERYYSDPSRYGYQFQTRVFHDRVKACQDAFNFFEGGDIPDIFILERSVYTDRIFMKMLHESSVVSDHEYRDYMDLWTMWRELMPFSFDMFIYLNPSVEAAMERIHVRARGGESRVTKDYQSSLRKEHDLFFKGDVITSKDGCYRAIRGRPIYHITTDENFIEDEKLKNDIVDGLLDKCREYGYLG